MIIQKPIKKYVDHLGVDDKVCSCCGKTFLPAPQHMYCMVKKGQLKTWQCGYTCWRKEGGDSGKEKHRVDKHTNQKSKEAMSKVRKKAKE